MLAIDGGTKVRATPFPARHLFGAEERAAALKLFDQAGKLLTKTTFPEQVTSAIDEPAPSH